MLTKYPKHLFFSLNLFAFGCQTVNPVQAEPNCLLDSCSQSDVTPHPSAQSVLGSPLQSCSSQPVTGFFLDSYCRTDSQDRGVHVVCAEMTEDFELHQSKGNDLSTAPAMVCGTQTWRSLVVPQHGGMRHIKQTRRRLSCSVGRIKALDIADGASKPRRIDRHWPQIAMTVAQKRTLT